LRQEKDTVRFLALAALLIVGSGIPRCLSANPSTARGTVTIDGVQLDAAVVPAYKYFKALVTRDYSLYQSAFSTNYWKYSMGRDPQARFRNECEHFLMAKDAPTAPPSKFIYQYDESRKPYPMVVYKYPIKPQPVKAKVVPTSFYSEGTVYVEKEGRDWKIGIPPLDRQKVGEDNANRAKHRTPTEQVKEMRLARLSLTAATLGYKPTPEYPRVWMLLVDWPVESNHVALVTISPAGSSLFIPGPYLVKGSAGDETVRVLAKNCVRSAQRCYEQATPTSDYSYPPNGRVRFYFVGFDGLRMAEADFDAARNGRTRYSDLFEATQRVISGLQKSMK
jgi:hypothetical protein